MYYIHLNCRVKNELQRWITESLRNQKPPSLMFNTPDQICRASVKTQLTVPDISQAEALSKGTYAVAHSHSPGAELALNSQSRAGTGINRCEHNCTR